MVFIYLLGFSAASIAMVAGYFSIYGLASIFSGWFWAIIAMGITLEVGKLVAASYLYRYRDHITMQAKWYLYCAILVLMLITSAGIFGFLSQGYQQDTLSLKQQEQRIELLQHEQQELIKFKVESTSRKKQIDDDIAALPNNYITARQRLVKTFAPEVKILKEDIAKYTSQINEKTIKISKIKQEKLLNEVHIGPIIFIARAFSTATDEAVKWLIFMLIFAFDPLAVMLTLATNNAMMVRNKQLQKETTTSPIIGPISEQKSYDLNDTLDRLVASDELIIKDLQQGIADLSDRKLSISEKLRKDILVKLLNKKLTEKD